MMESIWTTDRKVMMNSCGNIPVVSQKVFGLLGSEAVYNGEKVSGKFEENTDTVTLYVCTVFAVYM